MKKAAVRRVNEWDGPGMLKIYAPFTGTFAAPEEEAPQLQEYIRRIDRYTYGLGWILCELDSDPAGFCFFTEDREAPDDPFRVELQLYVKPCYQRRRVGTALWSLIRDISELGNRKQVTARVREENGPALSFLKAMGFSGEEARDGEKRLVFHLSPGDPLASRPTKPYLIENTDYEAAREKAAALIRRSS